VTVCGGRLAGAGCELSKIERDGEQERPMSSSGLYWADDDDNDVIKIWLLFL
jgi:hypothetical protein